MFKHPALSTAALVLALTGTGTIALPTTGSAAAATTAPASTTTAPGATASPTPTGTTSPTHTATPSASPTATPPNPATTAVLAVPDRRTLPGPKKAIPWPKNGRTRLEVAGIGVLGRSGSSKAAPIASVTKVMTAYVILRDHPLPAGANGPTIVVTAREAASYARRKAQGESLVKVAAGERISQRQALQGLLLASGNNMADILARWDAGSVPAFVRKMNRNADRLNLDDTHYADTSGLSSRSRSSTADLLKLAPIAMADPTFATIVAQQSATIPLNKIKNTNKLLGRHGVIGIKTGSTRAAGGCLLFATERTVRGRVYTIYGVVLGAPGPLMSTNARESSEALIIAARKTLHSATLLPAGRTVATLTGPDGTRRKLTLAKDLRVVGWPGLTYTLSLPPGLRPGQIPTRLTARTSGQVITVPLVTDQSSNTRSPSTVLPTR